jgi:CRP-like cAMP-binding protein
LHLLYSGRVIVQQGRLHLTLNELQPGSVFAEHALLRSRPEPHDIRATERGVVLELEADAYTKFVTPFLPAHSLEDSAEKVSLLRQLPISRHWPQAMMASFARRAVIQAFERGTQVLDEGRENTLFFLVIEGELRAVKDKRTVGRLRRGDIFGEISLLQNSITQADIVGYKPGRFLCVSKPDFLIFLTQNTQVALQIEAIASRRLGYPVFSPPHNPLRRKRR